MSSFLKYFPTWAVMVMVIHKNMNRPHLAKGPINIVEI
jgi:hypothetical protein